MKTTLDQCFRFRTYWARLLTLCTKQLGSFVGRKEYSGLGTAGTGSDTVSRVKRRGALPYKISTPPLIEAAIPDVVLRSHPRCDVGRASRRSSPRPLLRYIWRRWMTPAVSHVFLRNASVSLVLNCRVGSMRSRRRSPHLGQHSVIAWSRLATNKRQRCPVPSFSSCQEEEDVTDRVAPPVGIEQSGDYSISSYVRSRQNSWRRSQTPVPSVAIARSEMRCSLIEQG
jgi:hypothetical protein